MKVIIYDKVSYCDKFIILKNTNNEVQYTQYYFELYLIHK